jgi:uncharacterized membrane protein YqjE
MGLNLPGLSDLGDEARRTGRVLLSVLADRVELLGLELREAKLRFLSALVLSCLAILFGLLALVTLVMLALELTPAEARVYVLAGIVLAALVLAGAAALAVRRGLGKPLPFAQTLAELEKDKRCF